MTHPEHRSGTSIPSGYAAFQSELIRTAADLSRLVSEAKSLGDEALSSRADERLDHLASGAFVVALIGDFKRGKSTLANALLGAALMPADVEPATATINRVVYGREPSARVRFVNGEVKTVPVDALAAYVTKLTTASAAQAALVEEAVIEFPTRLCLNNVQLLDTPGLGDEAAMTERTLAMLPRIDAALVVTHARMPFGNTELQTLANLISHVDRARVFVVVNAIDQIDERDRDRVIDLAARRAAGVMGTTPRLFALSALAALQAKLDKNDAALEACGFRALEDALEQFLVRDSGIARLQAANETVEALAVTIRGLAANALAALGEADAADRDALATLEHKLDALRSDVFEWYENTLPRAGESQTVASAELNALPSRLDAALARGMAELSFDEGDVASPTKRHDKVRAAIDQNLRNVVESTVTKAVARINEWWSSELSALDRLAITLEALLEHNLPGLTSSQGTPEPSRTTALPPPDLSTSDLLRPLEEMISQFTLEYAPAEVGATFNSVKGVVMTNETVRGLLRGMGRDNEQLRARTAQLAEQLRSGYLTHLRNEFTTRLRALAPGQRLLDAYNGLHRELAPYAATKAQLIERVAAERIWALRVQRERLFSERTRIATIVSTAVGTVQAAETAARSRRETLRGLLGGETSAAADAAIA